MGPGSPTHTLGFGTSLRLPRGFVVSARGEYAGGHYITSSGESATLSRGIPFPPCYDAIRKREAGMEADLYSWERAYCFGGTRAGQFVRPADYFEVRDVTLNVPVSGLLPQLADMTRSSRIDLTVSGRNLWYSKSDKLWVGHPEMRKSTV